MAEIHYSTSSPRETALFNDYDARFRPYLTPLSGGLLTQFRGKTAQLIRSDRHLGALASTAGIFDEEGTS